MGRKTYSSRFIYDDEEPEDQMSDEEWNELRKEIKQQILDEELLWKAIVVYRELDDNWFWDPLYKPSVSEFVNQYVSGDFSLCMLDNIC